MIVEVQFQDHVQRLTWDDFEQRVREGTIGLDVPIRFPLLTGEGFRPAGDLEAVRAISRPGDRAFRQALTRPGLPIATALIVGLQLHIYLWTFFPGMASAIVVRLAKWGPAIWEDREPWRLFTYGLVHVEAEHILSNVLFLAYAGYHLERALGRASLLVLFITSVFAGGLLSLLGAPESHTIGSSGGGFGLLAAAVVLGWKRWDSIPASSRRYFGFALVPYVALSLMGGLSENRVDNYCHLGGLLAGAVLMTALEPDLLERRRGWNRIVRGTAIVAMAGATLAIGRLGPVLMPLETASEDARAVPHPAGWKESWSFIGDRGWASETGHASISAALTRHPRPATEQEAAARFVDKIRTSAADVAVVVDEARTVDGVDGREITLSFTHSGVPELMVALVLVRGVEEHRVAWLVDRDAAERLAPLGQRVLDGVRLGEPPEVIEATARVAEHPRSWEPQVELADALYRAGRPGEALAACDRALALSPGQPRALVRRLRTSTDYRLPGAAEDARAALREQALDPDVVVAAADALESAGSPDEARAALDVAWEALPGDRTLRKARNRRGMPVEREPTRP